MRRLFTSAAITLGFAAINALVGATPIHADSPNCNLPDNSGSSHEAGLIIKTQFANGAAAPNIGFTIQDQCPSGSGSIVKLSGGYYSYSQTSLRQRTDNGGNDEFGYVNGSYVDPNGYALDCSQESGPNQPNGLLAQFGINTVDNPAGHSNGSWTYNPSVTVVNGQATTITLTWNDNPPPGGTCHDNCSPNLGVYLDINDSNTDPTQRGGSSGAPQPVSQGETLSMQTGSWNDGAGISGCTARDKYGNCTAYDYVFTFVNLETPSGVLNSSNTEDPTGPQDDSGIIGGPPGNFTGCLAVDCTGANWSGSGHDYWRHTGIGKGDEYDYGFTVGVSSSAPAGSEFCLTAYVANTTSTAVSSGDIQDTSPAWCYEVVVPTISGTVYNWTEQHGIAGVAIHNCDGTVAAYTDATGNFSFSTGYASTYCVNPDYVANDPVSSAALDGPDPYSGWENETAYADTGGYDFYYTEPDLQATTDGPDTQALTPGQTASYISELSNTTYRNSYIGGTTNAALETFVPLNLNNISVSSATFHQWTGSAWVKQDMFCNDGGNHPPGTLTGQYQCGYDSVGQPVNNCGSCAQPNTPNSIFAQVSNMPANSYIDVSWQGTVKPASQISVYPGGSTTVGAYYNPDYRYCNNPTDWSTPANCTDFAGGMDGVTAFSRGSYHWSPLYSQNFTGLDYGPSFSGWSASPAASESTTNNVTANELFAPIPGTISCVGKNATNQVDNNAAATYTAIPGGSGVGSCGLKLPSNANYIYDQSDPRFSQARLDLRVQPDGSEGPVWFYLQDQNDRNYSNPTTAAAMDPAFAPTSCSPGYSSCANSGVSWQNIDSATVNASTFGTPLDYDVDVNYDNQASPGHVAQNQTKVCWYQYWLASHAVACELSNPITTHQAAVSEPYTSVDNGNVQGTAGTSCSLPTSAAEAGPDKLGFNTSEPYGRYVVAAGSGSFGANSSNGLVFSNSPQCRPDLLTSLQKYVKTYTGEVTSTGGSASGSIGGNWDKDVVNANGSLADGSPTPGDFVLGASGTTTTINNRFTLFVNGNLYIRGNIAYANAAASMGVVVEGNIYIEPTEPASNTQTVDGYYYAAKVTSPSVPTVGIINTCANGPNANNTLNPQNGGYTVAQCASRLLVNGLLMGSTLRLNRTSAPSTPPPNSGCAPEQPPSDCSYTESSEAINFLGNLYTNTPPGFSDLGTSSLLPDYLGENSPRY